MKTSVLAVLFVSVTASLAFATPPGGSYRGIDAKAHPYNGPYRSYGSSSNATSANSNASGWKYQQTLNGTPMRYNVSGSGYRSQVLINGKWH